MLLPALKMKLLILSVLVIGGAIAGKGLGRKEAPEGAVPSPRETIELVGLLVKRLYGKAIGNAAIAFWVEL
jgi:hypothetical protein